MAFNKTDWSGVIIDDELKFDKQVTNTCIKANYKSKLISKSFYLFNIKFRTSLFKIFIIPYFDYCSTLVTSVNSISLDAQNKNILRLTKCFNNNLKIFTFINLFTCENDLVAQSLLLKESKILSLTLRLFQRYYTFTLRLFVNKKNTILLNNFLQNNSISLRSFLKQPAFKKPRGKFSFRSIATKFANKYYFNEANSENKAQYLKYFKNSILNNFKVLIFLNFLING